MHIQTFLLAAASCISLCVYAQDKAEVQPLAEPAAHFTIFTGNTTSSHIFHLPASGVITIQKHANNTIAVKNYKLHGNWKTFYATSQALDEGNLVKGVPDGLWQSWYSNGQLRNVRTYSADLLQRVQQDLDLAHPKISRFIITERFKKEGRNVLQYMNASYSFGIRQFQLPSSIETLVEQNSDQSNTYHPPFSMALHHGLYINYFENGVVKDSGYYKEGLRHGIWLHRIDPSNGYWRGNYTNGVFNKEWKYYNAAGQLKIILHYNEAGTLIFRKEI